MTGLSLRAASCLALAVLSACGGGSGTNGIHAASTLFAPTTTVSLPSGRDPSAVIAADFDRDGRLDLVIANPGAGTVGFMRGAIGGAFGSLAEFGLGAGSSPLGLAAADMDRDGRLDLLVADGEGDRVVVLQGDGNGSFSPAAFIPVTPGGQPAAVVAADFDGDGRLDVAAANRALGTVSIARANGDGTYGPAASVSLAGGLVPSAIVAADLDRDGHVDLAIASAANGRVTVLLGRGDGTFGAPIAVAAADGGKLMSIAAADIDGDGILDLVAADWTHGAVVALLGVGDGTFAAPVASPAGEDPSGAALGDWNADGRIDVAVTLRGTNRIAVLLGAGGGGFALSDPMPSGGVGAAGIAAGDFDGNGALDLAAVNASNGTVGVLLGADRSRAPSFSGPGSIAIGAGFEPAAIVLADLDRDGALDLVTANRARGSVSVALGDGLGGAGPAVEFDVGAGTRPVALAVADFDGDGRLDVAVADALGSAVVVLRGSGTGSLAFVSRIALAPGTAPSAVVAADFDLDGKIDIAAANGGLGSVSIARGRGDGTFFAAAAFEILAAFHPGSLASGDFNRDGRPDLAAVSASNGTVAILFGDGTGSFITGPTLLVADGAALSGIAVADVNANGRQDLAVPDVPLGKVAVLLGGEGSFDAPLLSTTGAAAAAVVAVDVDRDGLLDLLVALEGTGRVAVLLGNGDGSFRSAGAFDAGGSSTVSLAAGDLNRDGRVDVVVANRGSGAAAILLGN